MAKVEIEFQLVSGVKVHICMNSQFVTLQTTTSTATIILGNCKAFWLKWKFCLLPSSLLHTLVFSQSGFVFSQGLTAPGHEVIREEGQRGTFLHLLEHCVVFTLSSFEKKHYYSTPFRKCSSSSMAQARPYSTLSRGSNSLICLGPHHPLLGSGLKFSPTPSTAPPQTMPGSLGKFTLNLTDFHPCPKDKEKWTFNRSLAIFPRELNHYEKLCLSKSEPCNK